MAASRAAFIDSARLHTSSPLSLPNSASLSCSELFDALSSGGDPAPSRLLDRLMDRLLDRLFELPSPPPEASPLEPKEPVELLPLDRRPLP